MLCCGATLRRWLRRSSERLRSLRLSRQMLYCSSPARAVLGGTQNEAVNHSESARSRGRQGRLWNGHSLPAGFLPNGEQKQHLTCSRVNARSWHSAGGKTCSCPAAFQPPAHPPEAAAPQRRQRADTHMKLLFPQPGGPYSR